MQFLTRTSMLHAGGHFLVSHGSLNEQRYGLDIVDGFNGFREFMEIHHKQLFSQIDGQFDHSGDFLLNDGLLYYQKYFFKVECLALILLQRVELGVAPKNKRYCSPRYRASYN